MEQLKCPPGLRIVSGEWHYRFQHQGQEWTANTGFKATKRNVNDALNVMLAARKKVHEGQGDQLTLKVQRFSDGAVEFLRWAEGEHKAHPSTARRLKVSFASLKKFFANLPVHSIDEHAVENFKTWRRLECNVQEVTLRHDLHALSPFFKYAIKRKWCLANPVSQVKVPSGEDAVRDHVVTNEEENAYFTTALSRFEVVEGKTKSSHGPFPALHDVARMILDQGMRPDEVMSLRVGDINLTKGTLKVTQGKTKYARRTLVLTPAVRSILGARMSGRMTGWVFEGKKSGTHLTKLNNAHDSVMKKIGAEFVLYEFRHTFATRFGESVGDPIALAAILGHSPSSLKLVMKYCHPQQSHTAAAMLKHIAASNRQIVENVVVN